MKFLRKLNKRHWFLILLLFFIFILRVPSLFEPNRYADEDIYLTLGQGMREGLVFYRDIHDNKPPFLYILAGLAGSLFWFRVYLLIAHAISIVFFFKLSELIFKQKSWAAYFSTLIFGIASTLPRLEGNIANGENFMIVPAIIGVFLLYRSLTKPSIYDKNWVYPGVGLLFSIGFMFKIPIAFDLVGILLFWWFFFDLKENIKKRFFKIFSLKSLMVVAGFLIPIIISIIYYAFNGALEPYLRSALMQNIGYLSSWGGSGGGMLQNPLVWRGLVIVGVMVLVLLFSKHISRSTRLLLIWSVFSMYGALLSSRPYPHYLLEPLVPVTLLLISLLIQIYKKQVISLLVSIFVLSLIFIAYNNNEFWYYETISYYKNYCNYVTGNKDWNKYLHYWGVNRNYEIASYVAKHTQKDERIYVWGTEPSIYSLSKRLPVGRYTVAYHVVDFDAFESTMIALRSEPPKYIVIFEGAPNYNQLFSFISEYYELEKEIDGALIYRRI